MRIPESELIINGDGSAFHIHIRVKVNTALFLQLFYYPFWKNT